MMLREVGARIIRLGGTTTILGGAYLWYDYKSCHPMRKRVGNYDPTEALIRFHNTCVNRFIPPGLYPMISLKELEQFNGTKGKPTFFSVGGTIYDVSSSDMFSSTYSQWAGKDATVALARMSMDPQDISRTDIWKSLSESDQVSLKSWTDYFDEKYYIKGRLKEWVEDTK